MDVRISHCPRRGSPHWSPDLSPTTAPSQGMGPPDPIPHMTLGPLQDTSWLPGIEFAFIMTSAVYIPSVLVEYRYVPSLPPIPPPRIWWSLSAHGPPTRKWSSAWWYASGPILRSGQLDIGYYWSSRPSMPCRPSYGSTSLSFFEDRRHLVP